MYVCVCIYIHTYITMLRTESACCRQMVTMYTLMCALGHSIPRALCARSDQIEETVDQILAAFPLTLCPPKTKSQANVTSV